MVDDRSTYLTRSLSLDIVLIADVDAAQNVYTDVKPTDVSFIDDRMVGDDRECM